MAATDYKYDVFFSYKRHDLTQHWTREVYKRIEHFLDMELARKPVMFVDEETIEVGERWPAKLQQALRQSRCMVGVWSPPYFRSSWCVSEWQSFLAREKHLGLGSHRLVAPLRYSDGEHFPEEAQKVQWHDVASFTSTCASFWTSRRALRLEDVLKKFAGELAKIINEAPPFDPAWPICDEPKKPEPKIELGRL